MLPNIATLPLFGLVAIFAAAAAIVWAAGTRIAGTVDAIATKLHLGPAFAGMLLLGGITSLPEIATVTTASLQGNATLAVNNLLGSAAINVLLLAVADVIFGRDALTSVVAKPATLMQGVLGMMLLSIVVGAIVAGDIAIGPVGLGSIIVALGTFTAVRVSAGFERRDVWRPSDSGDDEREDEKPKEKRSLARLVAVTSALGATILIAGAVLSMTADGIATQTGLSSGIVGFVLVAFATSLPELSSVTAAVRARRYELAVGDIFGTNMFNLLLLLLADAIAVGEPVLGSAGTFEVLGALLALLMTGAFTIGLLERQNRTVARMGYDSVAALFLFVGGVALMTQFAA